MGMPELVSPAGGGSRTLPGRPDSVRGCAGFSVTPRFLHTPRRPGATRGALESQRDSSLPGTTLDGRVRRPAPVDGVEPPVRPPDRDARTRPARYRVEGR